jgi:hypothetical protein
MSSLKESIVEDCNNFDVEKALEIMIVLKKLLKYFMGFDKKLFG